MWKLNVSKKEIARRLGITSARVSQVVLEHQRRYNLVEGRGPQPNPAQKYFNGSYRNDLKRLERGYEPWEYV
jgi:predicted transcriptional regulator